ncbi:MAG: PqiC family protein [Kiloniellales bacterium]
MILRLATAALGLFLLAACGSTPPTQVFGLNDAAQRSETPAPGGAPLIYVDTAVIADYLDRTQMVTRKGTYRISLHEFAIWSEPLGDLITASLVDDLAQRFGDDQVMATPIPSYQDPDWRVELDVLRFDVDEAGDAVIDVRWTLLQGRREDLAASSREVIVTKAATPLEPASRVDALREGLSLLSERIANRIAAG